MEREKIIQSYKHCSSCIESKIWHSDLKLFLICLLQFHAPKKNIVSEHRATSGRDKTFRSLLFYLYFSAASTTSLLALRCDLLTLSSSSTRSSCYGVHPELWRTLEAHYSALLLLRNTAASLKWCIFHMCNQAPLHLYGLSHGTRELKALSRNCKETKASLSSSFLSFALWLQPCVQYWPEPGLQQYGPMEVEFLSMSADEDVITRLFRVKNVTRVSHSSTIKPKRYMVFHLVACGKWWLWAHQKCLSHG